MFDVDPKKLITELDMVAYILHAYYGYTFTEIDSMPVRPHFSYSGFCRLWNKGYKIN